MQTFGNQLRIFARDADTMIEQIQAVLARQDIAVLDARRTQPRMEEAFISLVRQQEARLGNSQKGHGVESL
jgi:hypothetical protein